MIHVYDQRSGKQGVFCKEASCFERDMESDIVTKRYIKSKSSDASKHPMKFTSCLLIQTYQRQGNKNGIDIEGIQWHPSKQRVVFRETSEGTLSQRGVWNTKDLTL